MMQRDGPERRDAKETYEATIIEEKKMKCQKKKPAPRRGVSLFFFRVRGEQRPLQMTTVVLSAQ